jgi:small-conductance mechanosensitive channel
MTEHLPIGGETAELAAAENFYSGALRRIGVFMVAAGVLLVGAAWWRFGVRAAVGFGFGCLIAYVNFYWLERVIAGFVDRATGSGTSQSGSGIVFRFLLRYVLMAVGAYAILTVSPASLNGLLAGLFLPVAAILCEAGYEVYAAVARGI